MKNQKKKQTNKNQKRKLPKHSFEVSQPKRLKVDFQLLRRTFKKADARVIGSRDPAHFENQYKRGIPANFLINPFLFKIIRPPIIFCTHIFIIFNRNCAFVMKKIYWVICVYDILF